MANIKTIDDLKAPNPWKNNFNEYDPIPSTNEDRGFEFPIDIGDEQPAIISGYMIPVAICCPCCFGNPLRFVKSFLGIVSIVQIVMFVVEITKADGLLFSIPSDVLIELGARDTTLIEQGEIYRLITGILLHAGFFHILLNVYTQITFGIFLERSWGVNITAFVYLTAALFGNLLSVVLNDGISVGCSQALFGLLGAQIAHIITTWDQLSAQEKRSFLMQAFMMCVPLTIFCLIPFVDNVAHAGGFVCGFLLGLGIFSYNFNNFNARRFTGLICYTILSVAVLILALRLTYLTFHHLKVVQKIQSTTAAAAAAGH